MLLNAAGDFIFLFVIEFIARNSIVCGCSRCTHDTKRDCFNFTNVSRFTESHFECLACAYFVIGRMLEAKFNNINGQTWLYCSTT